MAAKLGKQKTRYNLADVIRYSMNVPCNWKEYGIEKLVHIDWRPETEEGLPLRPVKPSKKKKR